MSAAAPSTLEGTWALDKLHSTASFAVKHMVVSTFRDDLQGHRCDLRRRRR